MSETQVEAKQQESKDTQESIGSLLKNGRERNGQTVFEVAEALCLSSVIVKALENEDFDSLPEPPYVRGYLRSYAKFLGIDTQEIISLYEAQRGANPQDLEYHFKPANTDHLAKPIVSPTLIRLGLIALLLISLVGLSRIPAVDQWMKETWDGFSKQTADKNYAENLELAKGRLATPAPLPGDIATEQSTSSPSPVKKTIASADNSDSKNPSENKIDSNQEQNKTSKSAENNPNESIENGKETKLKFIFKKDVWMRIKDKNKRTIFEALSAVGTEKQIKLKRPMTFRIGSAQGVEIYIEGKRFDISPFTKGSVANFTIQ